MESEKEKESIPKKVGSYLLANSSDFEGKDFNKEEDARDYVYRQVNFLYYGGKDQSVLEKKSLTYKTIANIVFRILKDLDLVKKVGTKYQTDVWRFRALSFDIEDFSRRYQEYKHKYKKDEEPVRPRLTLGLANRPPFSGPVSRRRK